MLDTLYDNIGSKIKVWAQVIFIVETIGAVITGIVGGQGDGLREPF